MGWEKFWKGAERSAAIVGALATLVAAFYAAASYYGWTTPSEVTVKAVGHQAMTPSLPIWPALLLASVSVPLLVTGWVMIAVRRRRERTGAVSTTPVRAEPPVETDSGLAVNFVWGSDPFVGDVWRVVVSTTKRERDIAVVARFATVDHTITGSDWRWSDAKRIIERRDVIPRENVEAVIFTRERLTVSNQRDAVHILGEEIDLTNYLSIDVGFIVLFEITAASGDDATTKQTIMTFQRAGNKQVTHVLDRESLSFIKDLGRRR